MKPYLTENEADEVRQENWGELHGAGFLHFLNVAPEKLSEDEFLKLIDFVKEATGGHSRDVRFGSFFDDERQQPLDEHCDLGIYVRRPPGWSPFDPRGSQPP
jgi:hypothetical protein